MASPASRASRSGSKNKLSISNKVEVTSRAADKNAVATDQIVIGTQ